MPHVRQDPCYDPTLPATPDGRPVAIHRRRARRPGADRPPDPPPRGDDIEHTVHLSFEEAINGARRDITLTVIHPDGKQRQEKLTVKIPAGVDTGSKIRLRGKGQPGPDNNNGDLIIKIEVAPHKYFRRQGEDIYLEVPLTVTEAALGAKIEVPTLSGVTAVKIPPRSSSGRKLRLQGKGAKSHKTGKTGDMFLTLKIVPPSDLDDESQEILKKLAQRHPQNDIRKDWS